MNISELRDVPDAAADAAADLAAASREYFADVSIPDVDLPEGSAVIDMAGDAVELAGDVAGAVVTQSGRMLARFIRSAKRNPKTALGVVAVIVAVVALVSISKRRSSDAELDSVS